MHLSDEQLLAGLRGLVKAPGHLARCERCQNRRNELVKWVAPLSPPTVTPRRSAMALLAEWQREPAKPARRRPALARGSGALVASLALALMAGWSSPAPADLGAPRTLAAVSPAFKASRVELQWKPGNAVGLLTARHLPALPGQVLDVWLIHGRQHTAVAVIPLTSHTVRVWFRVNRPKTAYQAVGITLQPLPDTAYPTGPRIFFLALHPIPPGSA